MASSASSTPFFEGAYTPTEKTYYMSRGVRLNGPGPGQFTVASQDPRLDPNNAMGQIAQKAAAQYGTTADKLTKAQYDSYANQYAQEQYAQKGTAFSSFLNFLPKAVAFIGGGAALGAGLAGEAAAGVGGETLGGYGGLEAYGSAGNLAGTAAGEVAAAGSALPSNYWQMVADNGAGGTVTDAAAANAGTIGGAAGSSSADIASQFGSYFTPDVMQNAIAQGILTPEQAAAISASLGGAAGGAAGAAAGAPASTAPATVDPSQFQKMLDAYNQSSLGQVPPGTTTAAQQLLDAGGNATDQIPATGQLPPTTPVDTAAAGSGNVFDPTGQNSNGPSGVGNGDIPTSPNSTGTGPTTATTSALDKLLDGNYNSQLLQGGLSLVGGALNANAVKDAAAQQAASTQAALAQQNAQYQQTRTDNQPFLTTGTAATQRLRQLLGIDSGYNGADSGQLVRNFQASDLNADPVYQSGLQFGLNEGEKGINARAIANGGYDSGATLKALTQFGNDYGSTKANDSYNRYNTNNTNIYNRLAGVSGAGQTAANTVASTGQANAAANSNLITNQGNANAASVVGGANAWGGALNGINNSITQAGNSDILKKILGIA